MRVPMKWLQELVPVDMDINSLVDRLDLTGTAVEGTQVLGEALDGVVIGRIATKERHPEADRLWVTTVDVGDDQPRTIVCGAQNFEAGDIVPVALVGAILPGGMEIKRAKLRGVVSEGMNCSARELGLGDDHDGLLILPGDAPVGVPFAQWRGLSDTVLELEITPNRPDCLSMVGVAREVGAITGAAHVTPSSSPQDSGPSIGSSCTVHIAEPDLCPRYTARIIRGVSMGPSPEWLAERVVASGARSINAVVDVTNLVMFELGQPLHAFDLSTLETDADGRAAITVRRAQPGEELITLDGEKRVLDTGMLVIADPSGPVALAGVMGGESTEVSDATVDILLESACFAPASISRTSRALGLVSEASIRFERGVDRTGAVRALDRAATLIAELCGGTVDQGVVDEYPLAFEQATITLRLNRLDAVLGARIDVAEVVATLTALGCEVVVDGDIARVAIPSFRPDLEREIDLIEEVLRVHGMDAIASTLPAGARAGGLTPTQRARERMGEVLRACGMNETVNYVFGDATDPEVCDMPLADGELLVELLNPMSSEQSVLRRSLLPGLLRNVAHNQRHGVPGVHLYEVGSVFWTAAGRKQPKERETLAGVIAGSWQEASWNTPQQRLDFFDAKGVVETIVREFAIDRFKVRVSEASWLQPGRRADVMVGGEVVGWLGEVHPAVLQRFEVDAPVAAFELDLARLLRASRPARPFVDLPRHPAITLDLAIVVPDAVTSERVEQAIRSAGGNLLESVRLFDVYRGTGIEPGSVSLAFSLTYRADDRTLTAAEVDAAHERLVRKVLQAVGGVQR